MFGDLYFPEGLSNTLIPVLIPLYLYGLGVPLTQIAVVTGVSSLPWILKFMWSGPIDTSTRLGKRSFIFIGGMVGVVCIAVLFFIDPLTYMIPFTVILFISQMGQSLLDSAADAWAIQIIKREQRGKINSAMHIGMILGSAIGALVLSQIAVRFGYSSMFLVAACIILITLLLPVIVREVKTVVKRQKVTSQLIRELKNRPVFLLLFYIPLAAVTAGLLNFTLPMFARIELSLDDAFIGVIAAIVPLVSIPGSLLGGIIADRYDRRKLLYVLAIPVIIFILTFTVTRVLAILIAAYFLFYFIASGRRNVHFALYMDGTNPKIGGVQFSLFNGLANFGAIFTAMFAGYLIDTFGFNNVFYMAVLAYVPPLSILYFIHLNKKKK